MFLNQRYILIISFKNKNKNFTDFIDRTFIQNYQINI